MGCIARRVGYNSRCTHLVQCLLRLPLSGFRRFWFVAEPGFALEKPMNMYWVVLLLAVIVEIAWALSLKWIQMNPGVASIGTSLVLTGLNMLMLSYAMRGIPVGTAYAVWTGLGAVGITVIGIVWFKDPAQLSRLLFMGLIIVGVVGLKLTARSA
tara:strand:+ start:3430 stop:3894 length:465 start_codon:yes stop_codon:yes gene_type:complete